MYLFYAPDIISDIYTLSDEESKHAIKVLRLNEKDIIHLADGRGGFYKTEITNANPKHCEVKVLEKKEEDNKRNFYLHIAVAPTKNIERFEWFLEKATEIGIDEITPIECHRSERVVVKTERANKVITSAMKQSLKAYHPQLNELTKFKEFLKSVSGFSGQKFIAHCMEYEKLSLKNDYQYNQNVMILIGPEGDFTPEEVALAIQNNFKPISLGSSRLRTETAALTACLTINLLNE